LRGLERRDATTDLNAYRAGWTRVVLGALGLVLTPLIVPSFARFWLVYIFYIASALFAQILIKKDIGGSARALVGGIIDIAMVTFLVQRLGSASTFLVSIYVFIGMINALVVKRWVSFTLAAVGILAYASIVVAEILNLLPYAPYGPLWIRYSRPPVGGVVVAALSVAVLLLFATWIVNRLMSSVREHERELMNLNTQLEALSQRDPLTQLFNRRYLLDRIDLELARVRRGHSAALLMIDLDQFKRVNDRFGHLRGDDLLKRVADAIVQSVRATDVAGRYGGDEFAVLLSDTETGQAEIAAERLVKSIRDTAQRAEPDEAVTASIGFAVALGDDDSRSLLRRADQNSYRAKEKGGNCVVGSS